MERMSISMKVKIKHEVTFKDVWYAKYAGSVVEVDDKPQYDGNNYTMYMVTNGEETFPNEYGNFISDLFIYTGDIVFVNECVPVNIVTVGKDESKCIVVDMETGIMVGYSYNDYIMSLDDAKEYIEDSDSPYNYVIIEVTGKEWETHIKLEEKHNEEES